jgi:hypothetical protein
MNGTAGNWLGWLGIIVAVVGFFTMHLVLGIIGVILGIIGLFSPKKGLNWIAVVCGIIAILIGLLV